MYILAPATHAPFRVAQQRVRVIGILIHELLGEGARQIAQLHYKKVFSTYRGVYAARKMADGLPEGMPVLVRGKVKRNEASGI